MNLIELRNKYESARHDCESQITELEIKILGLQQKIGELRREGNLYLLTIQILDEKVVSLRKENPEKYKDSLRGYHVGFGYEKDSIKEE